MAVGQLVLGGGREWCRWGRGGRREAALGGRREAAGARLRAVDFVVAL